MYNYLILFFLLFINITNVIKAAETDQFFARDAEIRDSSLAINQFFWDKIKLGLKISNASNVTELSCREVALEVLTQVLGEFSLRKYAKEKGFCQISYYTQHSPKVDRFPKDEMSGKAYRLMTIYKKRPFPINVIGIARTININGIYIGTDKMGHFSIIGREYYKNFLDHLANGLTEEEAQEKAIKAGFKQEVNFLGYKLGGALSFADLEANFKGFQFARKLCEGENPYLIKENREWVENPKIHFDIKDYMTPKMDESYNVTFWSPSTWKRMKGDLTRAYCENKNSTKYKLRVLKYSSVLKETINDNLIAELIKENPQLDRNKQLLNQSCN